MNILSWLSENIFPISSSMLSLIISIVSTVLVKRMDEKINPTKEQLDIKINGCEVNLEDSEEREVIDLLIKIGSNKVNIKENIDENLSKAK